MKTKLTTKGFEEYLEAIAQAGADVDAAARDALAAGGEVLVMGMQARAPVDTGNLKAQINTTEPKSDGNFHYVEVGLQGADAETARYGNAQEYGTATMTARPYHRPTIDSDMGKARRAMRQVFEARRLL